MPPEKHRLAVNRLLGISAAALMSAAGPAASCESNLDPTATTLADQAIARNHPSAAYGAMYWTAVQGSGGAYRYLARMLEDGRGVARSPYVARHMNWMGSQYHDADAMFRAAKDFYAAGHSKDGDDLAERAARCGHPEALLLLVSRRSSEGRAPEALGYLQKAIEAGNSRSKFVLAEAYDQGGLGLPQDRLRAFDWYVAAAKEGIPEAMAAIAFYFVRGLHGVEDDLAALYWYHEAAKRGHVESLTAYGWMRMVGKGEPADREEAAYYLRKASALGDKQASVFLDELRKPVAAVAGKKG